MNRLLKIGGLCAALALSATGANAVVIATLTFDQRVATVLPTDSIPVYLTLTLGAGSERLATDGSGQINSGLSDEEVAATSVRRDNGTPDDPNDDYDEYAVPEEVTRRFVNNSFEGGDTFGAFDPMGAYAFDFNYDAPSFIAAANLDLQEGDSLSFLFGTFNPNGGAAAAGTYRFYNAIAIFQFLDPGRDPQVSFSRDIARTCAARDDSCAFIRTVEGIPGGGAVPEPGTWAMMLLGFGGVGAILRSSRRREALAA